MRHIFLVMIFLPVCLLAQRPVDVAFNAADGNLSAEGRMTAEGSMSADGSIAADRSGPAPVSLALEMNGYGTAFTRGGATSEFGSSLFSPALSAPPRGIPSRKSPFLAAVLSAVLPGAGEVYAGSYLLAGLFAALEGAGWYFNINENRLGDDKTGEYQIYANEHWSVVRYAKWLNANAKDFPGGENAVVIDIDENTPGLADWQRVNWEQMHATEMAIPQFSHRLPPYGDQQYYELIGKYNQYSYGWDDKTAGDYWNPSENFLFYSGMRGDANDHYNTADVLVNLLILNHVLSAVDAAWAAARFNQYVELQSGAQLQRLPDGRADLTATAQFSVRF